MAVHIPLGERAILGVVRPTQKHWESLLRCAQRKDHNGVSAAAAADCIAAGVTLTFSP